MRSLSIYLIVLAGLLAVLWWWQRPQPMPVQLIAVERGPVETLVANTSALSLIHISEPTRPY